MAESKTQGAVDSSLKAHASKLFQMPVDAITDEEVVEALSPIWTTKSETAARVRGRIEMVLDYARVRGHRTGENPARWKGHLEHLLPARRRLTRGHHPAAAYADLPAIYDRICSVPGKGAIALRFAILTAARSGEVRGARHSEIDPEKMLWTIPAERMKAGRPHEVPLTEEAMAILEQVTPARPDPASLVFPGLTSGKPLSDMTLSKVLRSLSLPITPHGFRSTFRDWAGDCTDFDRDTAEASLAHVIRDQTERAYRRGSALEKRRQLMKSWSQYCVSISPTA